MVISDSIRHSIVMVTYNQQHLIRRAIESVLNQSVLPYEIIIGDDCSTDMTFEIISEYKSLYPHIFKIYKHHENLGVFQNQNFVMHLVTGDIVSFLAGDDVLEDGVIEELNSMIHFHSVDINEKFVLVTNTLSIDKQGISVLLDNYRNRAINPFKLRLRYSIDYRSIGISSKLLKEAGPIPLDFGYYGDWIWAIKIDLYATHHYYSSFISAIYFTGIGVASKTKKEIMSRSRLLVIENMKEMFADSLSENDVKFLSLFEQFEIYQLSPNRKNYYKLVRCYLENFFDDFNRPYLFNFKNLIPQKILAFALIMKSKIRLSYISFKCKGMSNS